MESAQAANGWMQAHIWTAALSVSSCSLLKSVCAECWSDLDPEARGWLDASEARTCLWRVLHTLQQPHYLVQLAELIAPEMHSGGSEVTADPASTNSLAASSFSASQLEVEQELRAQLSLLLAELSQPDALDDELALMLEHVEARPTRPPTTFTPPLVQRQESKSAADDQNGVGIGSASSAFAARSASHSSASASSSPRSGAAPDASDDTSAAPSDAYVFRYEFNTVIVLWLEAQITRRAFQTEQGSTT